MISIKHISYPHVAKSEQGQYYGAISVKMPMAGNWRVAKRITPFMANFNVAGTFIRGISIDKIHKHRQQVLKSMIGG